MAGLFQKRKPLYALTIALTVLLFWLGHLMPPMQSPDEGTHLLRAYALSKGHLLQQTPQGQMTGVNVDKEFLAYGIAATYEWLNGERRLTADRREKLAAMLWEPSGAEVFFESPGTSYYAPVIYLPHALGLALGRWSGQTIETSVALASLLVSALSAGMLVGSIALWRPSVLALALLVLPMTLAQAASPTIDGLTTGALVLCLSLFARYWTSGAKMSASAMLVFFVCIVICATSRVHLIVLLALPFTLFFQWRHVALLAWGFVSSAVAMVWTVYALLTTVDLRAKRSMNTGEMIQHYAAAPTEFAGLLWRTIISPERQQQYVQSFIGIMGWLDAPLKQQQYAGLSAGLVGLFLLSFAGLPKGNWRARAILIGLGLVSAAIVFVALALTFTAAGATTVEGIQGRYFLAPALLVVFGAFWGHEPETNWASMPGTQLWRACSLAALLMFWLSSVVILVGVVQERYGLAIAASEGYPVGGTHG